MAVDFCKDEVGNVLGGFYCEYRIDDCKALPSARRCLNGGICQDAIANFTCLCPSLFTGSKEYS
jgi:EGF-like domain